jgi:hypothetical protein
VYMSFKWYRSAYIMIKFFLSKIVNRDYTYKNWTIVKRYSFVRILTSNISYYRFHLLVSFQCNHTYTHVQFHAWIPSSDQQYELISAMRSDKVVSISMEILQEDSIFDCQLTIKRLFLFMIQESKYLRRTH